MTRSRHYLDFELRIDSEGRKGRTDQVSVVHSPVGEAQEKFHFPLDRNGLEQRLRELQDVIHRSSVPPNRSSTADEQRVRRFGRQLFEALFPGEILHRYNLSHERARLEDKGLRLKLRFQSPTLAQLPWEFLFDPRLDDYICLSLNTPIVRYVPLPQSIHPLAVDPPLRILGMIASPDIPALGNSTETQGPIQQAIQQLHMDKQVEIHWLEGPAFYDVRRTLRNGPWHIFHFIDHSKTGEELIKISGKDGNTHDLSITDLSRLLDDHRSLRLAVVSSGGIAANLIRRGIPAVVVMRYPLTNQALSVFTHSLYEAVADGQSIDVAVAEARVSIRGALPKTLEWGTPVLYMGAPDGVLFDIRQPAAAEQLPASPSTTQPTIEEARRSHLRQILDTKFSESELRDLCFDLAIDYDNLPGWGKGDKARELVTFYQRRERLDELEWWIKHRRPDITLRETNPILPPAEPPPRPVIEPGSTTQKPKVDLRSPAVNPRQDTRDIHQPDDEDAANDDSPKDPALTSNVTVPAWRTALREKVHAPAVKRLKAYVQPVLNWRDAWTAIRFWGSAAGMALLAIASVRTSIPLRTSLWFLLVLILGMVSLIVDTYLASGRTLFARDTRWNAAFSVGLGLGQASIAALALIFMPVSNGGWMWITSSGLILTACSGFAAGLSWLLPARPRRSEE